ncbi:MAG: hypothetical protein JST68_15115, partial [Bacteroidetes bacterium]|nr:hypothetical protein [Bacteroidota bacterium]
YFLVNTVHYNLYDASESAYRNCFGCHRYVSVRMLEAFSDEPFDQNAVMSLAIYLYLIFIRRQSASVEDRVVFVEGLMEDAAKDPDTRFEGGSFDSPDLATAAELCREIWSDEPGDVPEDVQYLLAEAEGIAEEELRGGVAVFRLIHWHLGIDTRYMASLLEVTHKALNQLSEA